MLFTHLQELYSPHISTRYYRTALVTRSHTHSHTSEPAGMQSSADCHCTSSHSLTVTCIRVCTLVKANERKRDEMSFPPHPPEPLQCWMCSSLSPSPLPHTPSLHALCPVSPSGGHLPPVNEGSGGLTLKRAAWHGQWTEDSLRGKQL